MSEDLSSASTAQQMPDKRGLRSWLSWKNNMPEVFEIHEVETLMRYASERGIGAEDGLLDELYNAATAFRAEATSSHAQVILKNYTRLCQSTKPVTGRNLDNSANLLFETNELLVEKMNLQTLQRQKTASDAIAEFLAKEIASTDPQQAKAKYDVLVDLLKSRS